MKFVIQIVVFILVFALLRKRIYIVRATKRGKGPDRYPFIEPAIWKSSTLITVFIALALSFVPYLFF